MFGTSHPPCFPALPERPGEGDEYWARAVEQVLIDRYGLDNLLNKKSCISPRRKDYELWYKRGEQILRAVGL